MNKIQRIQKMEKWLQEGLSPELAQDLEFHYKLDKYTLDELFTDEELALLDPLTAEIKIEAFAPLFKNQDWLQYRLSVYTVNKTLLTSKTLPPNPFYKHK